MDRILPLKSAVNYREMGGYKTTTGYTTKWHKLIRCGSLSYLSKKDVSYIYDYGTRYIIDFRSNSETSIYPDKKIAGVTHVNAQVYPFENSLFKNLGVIASMKLGKVNFIDEAYAQMLVDSHAQQAYRQFFKYLLENDKDDESLVFHCTAGKDRTGVGAFLVLSALKVEQQTILEDYLLTNLAYSQESTEQVNKLLTHTPANQLADKLNTRLAVSQDNFEILNKVCVTLCGSVEQYLKMKLGLTSADLTKLQQIYLE